MSKKSSVVKMLFVLAAGIFCIGAVDCYFGFRQYQAVCEQAKVSQKYREVLPKQQAAVERLANAMRPLASSLGGIADLKNRQGAMNAPLRMVGNAFTDSYQAVNDLYVALEETKLAMDFHKFVQSQDLSCCTPEHMKSLSIVPLVCRLSLFIFVGIGLLLCGIAFNDKEKNNNL